MKDKRQNFARKLLIQAAVVAPRSWRSLLATVYDRHMDEWRSGVVHKRGRCSAPTIERIVSVSRFTRKQLGSYDDPTPQDVDDFVKAVFAEYVRVRREGRPARRAA
jgi:alpha-D-ribose 1-methylphosphonate 5-triphosphate diphosphatase PhnM